MQYYEYIHSEEWRQKRNQVLKRDGFRCQMCGTAKNLRVHHISYEHLNQDEELDDLITLCDNCHTKIHEQDIKHKGTVPACERNSSMFRIALRLLRENSSTRAWDKYKVACRQCTPPLSENELGKIWLSALKIVEGWD